MKGRTRALLSVLVLVAASLRPLVRVSPRSTLRLQRRGPPTPFRQALSIHSLSHGTEEGELYDPFFQFVLFPPKGAYPVFPVANIWGQCRGASAPSIMVVSRRYRHTPQLNHSLVEVEVEGHVLSSSWFVSPSLYESVAIGTFPAGDVPPLLTACATESVSPLPLRVHVAYNGSFMDVGLNITRDPPPSDFAMVAIFNGLSAFLLRLWVEHWSALGVGTFYLFSQHDTGDSVIPQLHTALEGISASVVFIDWKMLHWITTEGSDITHGQPMAINMALRRWKHLHKWMAFYDTDEFLVLPHMHGLASFVSRLGAVNPITAFRSQCTWAFVNLSMPTEPPHNITSIGDVRLLDLLYLPIVRNRISSSREKYMLNVSAIEELGIEQINIHGIYSHQADRPRDSVVLPAKDSGLTGYHLHLLNTVDPNSRKRDARDLFLTAGDTQLEENLADLIRRSIISKADAARSAREGLQHKLMTTQRPWWWPG